jgi:hypothetical protein
MRQRTACQIKIHSLLKALKSSLFVTVLKCLFKILWDLKPATVIYVSDFNILNSNYSEGGIFNLEIIGHCREWI